MKGTMDYVTITEAARLCGVCHKTIQRAIHKGLLPARYPYQNQCEIALSDLEQFIPGPSLGHVQVSTEDRIAALEQRIQILEQQVQDLLNQPETVLPHRPARRTERVTGPLPRNLISLTSFARLHGMAETTVLTHADISLLPAKRGEWTDHDGMVVTLALDAKGRKAFYQLYRDFPFFTRCSQCPHGYMDTV
jgi:polyhydroxyalkanoate synthesis regulator phasin